MTNYNLISCAIPTLFNNIKDKINCSFIQFDIKQFYLSINEDILHQTLEFAKQHTNIDKNDLHIMSHCRKLLLFSDNNTLIKKLTDSYFDIAMSSFNGAEVCELAGFYIKSKLGKILRKSNFGLYWDDKLALLRIKLTKLGKTSSEVKRMKLISKNQIFKTFHLICKMKLIALTKN